MLILNVWHQIEFPYDNQCPGSVKIRKNILGPTYKLRSSFTTIPDVYRLFVRNKSTFGDYGLTQWISMLFRNFFPEI